MHHGTDAQKLPRILHRNKTFSADQILKIRCVSCASARNNTAKHGTANVLKYEHLFCFYKMLINAVAAPEQML